MAGQLDAIPASAGAIPDNLPKVSEDCVVKRKICQKGENYGKNYRC
jgi:hypothetical protein